MIISKPIIIIILIQCLTLLLCVESFTSSTTVHNTKTNTLPSNNNNNNNNNIQKHSIISFSQDGDKSYTTASTRTSRLFQKKIDNNDDDNNRNFLISYYWRKRRRQRRQNNNIQLKMSTTSTSSSSSSSRNTTSDDVMMIMKDDVNDSNNTKRNNNNKSFFSLLKKKVRTILWPKSNSDPLYSNIPLPHGSLGCPFIGYNTIQGNRKDGPEYWIRKFSSRYNYRKLIKFYAFGTPIIGVTGSDIVNDLLNQEFITIGYTKQEQNERKKEQNKVSIFGGDHIAAERDRTKHATLRRLVGTGTTGSSLMTAALPILITSANECIDRILVKSNKSNNNIITIHNYCVDYTIDFVQKQILGCDKIETDIEREQVRNALTVWLAAMFDISALLPIQFLIKRSKAYKARLYLQTRIEEKINQLQINGPDTSTISNMLFAVDNKDSNNNTKKLTRQQVIDNALFLVAAGTENTSTSLSLAIFLLGLHPDIYNKLVQEQYDIMKKFNNNNNNDDDDNNVIITQDELEECTYLDAVVQETLRIGPVSGGFLRRVRETIIIDGEQIPKGWSIFPNIRLTHQLDPALRGDRTKVFLFPFFFFCSWA